MDKKQTDTKKTERQFIYIPFFYHHSKFVNFYYLVLGGQTARTGRP